MVEVAIEEAEDCQHLLIVQRAVLGTVRSFVREAI
jgi:hypothetical protein